MLKQHDFGEGSEVVEFSQHAPLTHAMLRWNIPEWGHPIRILSLAVLMTGIQSWQRASRTAVTEQR